MNIKVEKKMTNGGQHGEREKKKKKKSNEKQERCLTELSHASTSKLNNKSSCVVM